jgi:pimeloyl-CoA synthetase
MSKYDSLAVAIEIQAERTRAKQMVQSLEAFALAVKARADNHRAAMDTATGSDLDYLEGLVDGYDICYNQIMEILNKESN